MFHERKLEHLGVTVRVCGYQPQGVPSLRGHPLPQKIEPLDSQLHGTQQGIRVTVTSHQTADDPVIVAEQDLKAMPSV